MAVFLLAYDLVNEPRGSFDYEPLWTELKRLNAHRTQYSLWLVSLTNTVSEVKDHFKGYMDENDRIWVAKLRPNPGGFSYVNAMPGTTEWLANHPVT